MSDDAFDTAMAKRSIRGLRLDREAVRTIFAEIEDIISELPLSQDSVTELDK